MRKRKRKNLHIEISVFVLLNSHICKNQCPTWGFLYVLDRDLYLGHEDVSEKGATARHSDREEKIWIQKVKGGYLSKKVILGDSIVIKKPNDNIATAFPIVRTKCNKAKHSYKMKVSLKSGSRVLEWISPFLVIPPNPTTK